MTNSLPLAPGSSRAVVSDSLQVRVLLIRRELADGPHRAAFRKIRRAAAVGRHAGEQVRRDRDVAGRRDLIGEVLHPVRHAENLMDDRTTGTLDFVSG